MTETLSDLITQRLATVGKMGLSHLQENSAKFVYLEWYQRALALEQWVEGLETAVHLAQLFLGDLRPSADDVDEITQGRIDQFIELTNSLAAEETT